MQTKQGRIGFVLATVFLLVCMGTLVLRVVWVRDGESKHEDVKSVSVYRLKTVGRPRIARDARMAARKAVDRAIQKKKNEDSDEPRPKFTLPEDDPDFTQEERVLVKTIQECLDCDDFEGVASLAEIAVTVRNEEVRMHFVDALGWFGEKALPELTVFLADANEDVAQSALDKLELALQEVDDDYERVAVAQAVLMAMNNSESMDYIMGELTSVQDELTVMQALVDMISGENEVAAHAAKEAYESMTDEEWTNIDAAEDWLRENYEPSEPDDEDDDSTGRTRCAQQDGA